MHGLTLTLIRRFYFCSHSEARGGYELTPICPTVVRPFILLLYAVTFPNCADWPKGGATAYVCTSCIFDSTDCSTRKLRV